ncbi:VOC family protein [Amycolatopsis sp. Hca4]|uniref:VOC family protein n=1 Tax=unclassified Amycolatopsis TaxID=2618356 RepID=UPI001592074F|nr:VOC family protein [Amycolatopsis sp. Hca4]QKV75217.1 VOC family protein [Amycolatopsis sp. Hca4]
MAIHMGMITIDCAEPRQLAQFWTAALGTTVAQDYEGEFLILAPAAEGGLPLALQRVPEPREGKNRAHIDFGAENREAEVKRLVGLGAKEVAEHEVPGLAWTVLQDPEGNEFCVSAAVH